MSPEGGFLGRKITEQSIKPAQREAVDSLSRGRINWQESSLGVLASFMAFSFFFFFFLIGIFLPFTFAEFLFLAVSFYSCFFSAALIPDLGDVSLS